MSNINKEILCWINVLINMIVFIVSLFGITESLIDPEHEISTGIYVGFACYSLYVLIENAAQGTELRNKRECEEERKKNERKN